MQAKPTPSISPSKQASQYEPKEMPSQIPKQETSSVSFREPQTSHISTVQPSNTSFRRTSRPSYTPSYRASNMSQTPPAPMPSQVSRMTPTTPSQVSHIPSMQGSQVEYTPSSMQTDSSQMSYAPTEMMDLPSKIEMATSTDRISYISQSTSTGYVREDDSMVKPYSKMNQVEDYGQKDYNQMRPININLKLIREPVCCVMNNQSCCTCECAEPECNTCICDCEYWFSHLRKSVLW